MLQQIDLLEAQAKKKEPFKMSKEEVEKFQKAFQDKEFRDLFKNYVEEISNPESRKLYEQEIQQLEEERGNAIRWVRPSPHWVIQTTGTPSANIKATTTTTLVGKEPSGTIYINFASSTEIQVPTSKPSTQGTQIGATWSLPHSLTAPRPDLDANGETVEIYDIVYHPDAYANPQWMNMLVDAGISSLESNFSTRISKAYTLLKDITYKGNPVTTTIRTPLRAPAPPPPPATSAAPPPPRSTAPPLSPPRSPAASPAVEQPRHEFVYQHAIDVSDFTQHTSHRDVPRASRRDTLLVRVHLPKVKQVAEIDVQVTDTQLVLHVPHRYYTLVALPKKVDPEKAKAKWISDKHVLELACPPAIEN